jgi:hypothetical protein
MDWNLLIMWAFFMGALWRAYVWRGRARREHRAHMQCHRNFDAILEKIGVEVVAVDAENMQPTPSGVMWVNPEAVKNNGHSDN